MSRVYYKLIGVIIVLLSIFVLVKFDVDSFLFGFCLGLTIAFGITLITGFFPKKVKG